MNIFSQLIPNFPVMSLVSVKITMQIRAHDLWTAQVRLERSREGRIT